jgi:hypothetical protein
MKLATGLALLIVPAVLSAQGAQKAAPKAAAPAIPAGAVGTWDGKSMIGPKDSVITQSTTVIAADGKVTVTLQGRAAMPAKVLAAGGDSVTWEIGPYESVLKKGMQATTRSTSHYKGNTATGTFEAKYTDGSTVKGKAMATKKADAAPAPAKKP